jgi:hypothetical protein
MISVLAIPITITKNTTSQVSQSVVHAAAFGPPVRF